MALSAGQPHGLGLQVKVHNDLFPFKVLSLPSALVMLFNTKHAVQLARFVVFIANSVERKYLKLKIQRKNILFSHFFSKLIRIDLEVT